MHVATTQTYHTQSLAIHKNHSNCTSYKSLQQLQKFLFESHFEGLNTSLHTLLPITLIFGKHIKSINMHSNINLILITPTILPSLKLHSLKSILLAHLKFNIIYYFFGPKSYYGSIFLARDKYQLNH